MLLGDSKPLEAKLLLLLSSNPFPVFCLHLLPDSYKTQLPWFGSQERKRLELDKHPKARLRFVLLHHFFKELPCLTRLFNAENLLVASSENVAYIYALLVCILVMVDLE